jgi:CheY-like chemotaxis protein
VRLGTLLANGFVLGFKSAHHPCQAAILNFNNNAFQFRKNMKLDFETNTANISSVVEESYSETGFENSSADVSPMLRAGIKAAQEGNRAEAKLLLLQVTETEPKNEEAWMHLASVSEYPEELLSFLGHVLEINPNNERALEWTKSTKNLLSKNLVERGMSASKDSHKEFAKQCFLKAIVQDEENETAWLWLASVSDSAEEKTAYLQKVLALNPKNENAIVLLKSVKNQKIDGLLQRAVAAAVADERKTAKQMIEIILGDEPKLVEALILKSFLVESFEEKINCFEKILDVDDENELANLNWTALLDIMSKAESPTQNASINQSFAAVRDDYEESETSPNLPELNETFEYDAVSFEEDLEAIQPSFQLQAVEKENFDSEEMPEEVELRENNEESFAYSEQETLGEETEVFEASTQNDTDYSPLQSEPSQEISEDYSQYASSEVSTPEENLPSYYDSEEVSESLPAENDYSQEFKETEQDVFVTEDFEPQEHSVSVEAEISQEVSAEADSGEAVFLEEKFCKSPDEMLECQFCYAKVESQSFVCDSCHTMLTLSDLEMLLAHQDANQEVLREAVERMEDERNRRDFGVEELKLLAVGHLNLKNLRQGCVYLEEAAQMNPNDVFLGSQVNFLKIRLAEIEDQKSVTDSMPKNRKILVVDDSATVRKLISGKLEKSGHEVFCAVDGVDALEQIKEFVPDLILLDINMPRMDGYQVCKLLRSAELTKDVPIVMISGKDGFFDKVRGRMAGTTGYITKPFGPETLMKMLETYIV